MVQDAFGRKKMIMYNYLLLCLGFVLIYFGPTKEVKVCGFLLMWGYMEVFCFVMNVLLSELLVNPLRNYSGICISIMTLIGGIFGNLVTYVITDYYTFVLFIFLGYSFSTLLFAIFIPESPYFLLRNNDKMKLERFICNVAEFNKVPEEKLFEILESLDSLVESNGQRIYF
jgi:MFS family permease